MKSAKNLKIKVVGEVLKVLEIEVSDPNANSRDTLFFRIELLKGAGQSKAVTARVWRKEFYRIKPSFPQKRGNPSLPASDEVLLVEETSIFGNTTSLQGRSVSAVLKKIRTRLNQQLNA